MSQREQTIQDERARPIAVDPTLSSPGRATIIARASEWLIAWWQANRAGLAQAAVAFFSLRIALSLIAVLAASLLPEQTGLHSTYHRSSNVWLDVWARWDSEYYLDIAEHGYRLRPELSVFSYLYPMLLSLVAPFAGHDFVLAGVLVSSVSTFVALFYMFKLASLELGAEAGSRAVLYLAAYPVAFFLLAVYTESTFLAITLASFYFVRKGAWGRTAGGAFFCGLARPVGFMVAIPFAYEALRQSGWRLRALSLKMVLAVLAGPLGWLIWAAYLGLVTDDPLIVLHSRSQPPFWRAASLPWDTIGAAFARLGSPELTPLQRAVNSMDLAAALLVLEASIVSWWALPRAYALYCAISAWLLLSLTVEEWPLQSMSRYSLAVFPIFLLLAKLGARAEWHRAIMIGSATLLGLLTALFATWYWIF